MPSVQCDKKGAHGPCHIRLNVRESRMAMIKYVPLYEANQVNELLSQHIVPKPYPVH